MHLFQDWTQHKSAIVNIYYVNSLKTKQKMSCHYNHNFHFFVISIINTITNIIV